MRYGLRTLSSDTNAIRVSLSPSASFFLGAMMKTRLALAESLSLRKVRLRSRNSRPDESTTESLARTSVLHDNAVTKVANLRDEQLHNSSSNRLFF
jgi:hypothetical protein